MEGVWGNVCVAHEGLSQRVNAMIPMAEHVCVSVDRPIRKFEGIEPPINLRVQDLPKVVEAMQLMPNVQFDEVVLRSWNGKSGNR